MNVKSILKLAEITGVTDKDLGLGITDYGDSTMDLIKFAKAIAAAERESCVAICEIISSSLDYTGDVDRCINVIRRRE